MNPTLQKIILSSKRVLIRDTFSRVNTALGLGVAESGQTWAADTGILGITNKAVYGVSGTSPYYAIAKIPINTLNITASALMIANPYDGGRNGNILVRYIDKDNHLRCLIGVGAVTLYKYDSSVLTILATSAITTTNGVWYELKVVAKNEKIKLFVNGTQKIDYTLTGADLTKFTGDTCKNIALKIAGTFDSVLIDNFYVEAI